MRYVFYQEDKSVDRFEILKLAIASSKDAEEALALAQQMAAFVENTNQTTPFVENAAAENKLTLEVKRDNIREFHGDIHIRAANAARAWSDANLLTAAEMIEADKPLRMIADTLGRTPSAVDFAWRSGKIPTKRPYPFGKRGRKRQAELAKWTEGAK
jgi:hypothetical protein